MAPGVHPPWSLLLAKTHSLGGEDVQIRHLLLQVTSVQHCKDMASPQPAPVLTPETFSTLCAAQPVQGAHPRLRPRSCVPLSLEELQQPQLLLGLDAEFVALSAPHANIKGYALAIEHASWLTSGSSAGAPERISPNIPGLRAVLASFWESCSKPAMCWQTPMLSQDVCSRINSSTSNHFHALFACDMQPRYTSEA